MMKRTTSIVLLLALVFHALPCRAAPPDPQQLHMAAWTPQTMVQDPVALAWDGQGRLYVVETARRSTVDIDIRGHRSWLLEDLASDDFDSMRDFFRRQMASERSGQNKSWLQDRNRDGVHDYRDLTTVQERLRVVEDTDEDGLADKSTIFAEGFNEEFNGVAAGVLPYRGDVFFTIYPDLWRLRDHDGDQIADSRESMFRGFGVHAALDGHDLHGLTVGPEGKIYFSCGDNGFSLTTQEGKRLHYPNTGGVLRMNPDGSDLEVYAVGLRNVQEFDFDQYGNMFGVDNDGDLEDERERAVYIAEASDSGWRLTWQFRSLGWAEHNGGMTYNPWTADGMWKPAHAEQPAYITPPMQNYSVGPGGFKFNPGTALNDAYRDFFFCVQFPVQKVTAFRTQPRGAGFEMVDEHVFNSGLMVSSLNFGPDGGCYLADWVGMWSPNNQGMIYRVDDPAAEGSPLRREVAGFLRHGVESQSEEQLVQLLGHADRRIRQLAQYELAVQRKQLAPLFRIANDPAAETLARIHGLWGILQYHQQNDITPAALQLPWTDDDAQIRQQCARVAGDLRLESAGAELIRELTDPAALVQSHAAIALGKLGTPSAVPHLIALARSNADQDPYLRHAAAVGLAGCAQGEDLAALVHDTIAVQRAAVVALRRQGSPHIAQYLDKYSNLSEKLSAESIQVLREAVRAVHDDFSIPVVLPQLAEMLSQNRLPQDEAIVRRILSANFRLGTPAAAERLVDFVVSSEFDDPAFLQAMRLEAIQCLARWDQAPLVDRVEGRIRRPVGRVSGAGREALVEKLVDILASEDDTITTEMLHMARELSLPIDQQQLFRWVKSDDVPVDTRVGALRLLATQKIDDSISDVLDVALASEDWSVHQAALEIVSERNPAGAWPYIQWNTPNLMQKKFYISLLPELQLPAANKKLVELINAQREGSGDDWLSLDVYEAATGMENLQGAWRTELEKAHPLGKFQLALHGGDADRGRVIYRNHVSAQCIRCHDAGGVGKQAGPVLDGIAGRVDRQYLLESLVTPSAKIATGYASVTLVLVDGRTVQGTIIRELDHELVVGLADGKRTEVSIAEIEERVESKLSAMPEMTNVLTAFEIRDLVAYLTTLSPLDDSADSPARLPTSIEE